MAHDIHGERNGQAGHAPDGLQVAVDTHELVAVLPAPCIARLADEGEQIGRVGGVPGDDGGHLGLHLDHQGLSRLLAPIDDVAVYHVALAQVGHVYETHAAGVETEEGHVAGKTECGTGLERQLPDAPDVVYADGALGGLVYPGVDLAKGLVVGGQPLLYGGVVGRAQVAHIERGGVAEQSPPPEIGLVEADGVFVECFEGHIHIGPEVHETA